LPAPLFVASAILFVTGTIGLLVAIHLGTWDFMLIFGPVLIGGAAALAVAGGWPNPIAVAIIGMFVTFFLLAANYFNLLGLRGIL